MMERKWRAVRVFISSTFRDMQEERDELVKNVFPQLRLLCRRRGLEFIEVDLRWGVTEEQAERGGVLPICLAEIDRCSYFIGLLGERYGWVPEHFGEELIEERPWLNEDPERSLTELEILHGVLNKPDMVGRAFFYFRNLEYLKRIPVRQLCDFQAESQLAAARLSSLKNVIRVCGQTVREGYPDPATAGQWILRDLTVAIEKEYPIIEEPDLLDREAAEHNTFAESRARVYVGKAVYFDRLETHIIKDGKPLVVLGKSGSGKSALLANWMRRYREYHPEDFVLEHYIGGTADSSDYGKLLRRIMREIKRHYELVDEIPTDDEKIREAFPFWIAQTAEKGRFVLILDGLNQLEDRDNALDLGWLPTFYPSNVRLIVSTLPGRSLDALQKRDWPELSVEPLEPVEQKEIIDEYLTLFGKSLNIKQMDRIIGVPQTANPLYLRVLLNELRIFGSHEQLDPRIDYYLKAGTVQQLYEKILHRLEEDYERERPGLVRDAMSLMWAARRGLAESELLGLLGEQDKSLPRAVWSPLYLAIEEALVNRSGLLAFFHDYLRQAVEHRYLKTDEDKRNEHLCLADYFEQCDLDERKVEELPWQLQQAKVWERLKDCVGDLNIFDKLRIDTKRYELVGYWLAIGERYDMVNIYRQAITELESLQSNSQETCGVIYEVARFLYLNARYEGAEELFYKCLYLSERNLGTDHRFVGDINKELAHVLKARKDFLKSENSYQRALIISKKSRGSDPLETGQIAIAMGGLLWQKTDYSRAETLIRQGLNVLKEELGEEHPETAVGCNELALALWKLNRYMEAKKLYEQALNVQEKIFGAAHPDTAPTINNLGLLLSEMGDEENAEKLFRRALAIFEEYLGPEHPHTAFGLENLAGQLSRKGDYKEAEQLCRRALDIREKVHGPEHLDTATSLNNLATSLYDKGDYEGSENCQRRALEIEEKILGPEHLDTVTSLNNLASSLYGKGDYEGSENYQRRALKIQEKILGPEHKDTAESLSNLADHLRIKGDFDGAEQLERRALAIKEKILGSEHPDTARGLSKLAILCQDKGDYDRAEQFYRRSLVLRQKVPGPEHPDTATCLNNLADLLSSKGDHAEAEKLFRRVLEIRRKVLGPEHPDTATSLNGLATMLRARGSNTLAEQYHRQALVIHEKILGEDPITAGSLNNLAVLLNDKGEYEEADELYRRALKIYEITFSPKHPHVARVLANLAELSSNTDKYSDAERFYRQSIDIFQKAFGPEHPDTLRSVLKFALLLRNRGQHKEAAQKFRHILTVHEKIKETTGSATSKILNIMAICHNELAFHKEVPDKNWERAEYHYRQAIALFHKIPNLVEAANAELNLQTMFKLSSQPVDLVRVKELTKVLEDDGDSRAKKGSQIVEEL
jgi:tetratricopeptide (TPR) repeat protein